MARKRENRNITTAAVTLTDNNSHNDPKPQPRNPRDLSPDNKKDSLKTLNNLLLKETMENRAQIDHLKSQLQDLSDAAEPLASDLERDVRLLVLSRSLADHDAKLRSLEDSFDLASRENGEMKKASILLTNEVDSRRRVVGELEARVGDLERENGEMRERLALAEAERDEMRRKGTKSAEAYDSLIGMMDDVEKEREELSARHEEEVEVMRAEIEANVRRLSLLEEEGHKLLELRGRLEAEAGELKADFALLKKEEEGLRLRVYQFEKMNSEAEAEIGRIGARIIALEKEKEEKDKGFELTVGELMTKLDEMRETMEGIVIEKDELVTVKAKQEAEITKLKNEIDKLHSDVAGLNKMCEEYNGKNTQLQDERDALKRESGVLEEKLKDKEKVFVASIEELEKNLADLSAKMALVSAEKDKVDSVRVQQEVEILELMKEVGKLGINALELQEMSSCYSEKIIQLQHEKDEVGKDLAAQAEEAAELRLGIEELKKRRDETCEELKELSSLMDAAFSEKEEGKRLTKSLTEEKASLEKFLSAAKEKLNEMEKRSSQLQYEKDELSKDLAAQAEEAGRLQARIEELMKQGDETCEELKKLTESLNAVLCEKEEGKRLIATLTEEKASLENRLLAAKEEFEEMGKKLKCTQMISDKVLALLKSAAEDQENENGVVVCDGEEIIRPFADAVESIRCAFRSREAKIEKMNEELKSLQTALDDVEKKKKQSRLLKWLYPATTTLLAAFSFAYASRAR